LPDQAVFPQREQLQRGYGKNGKESEKTAQQAAQKDARVRDTNGGVFWKIIRRKNCTSGLNPRYFRAQGLPSLAG